MKKANFIFIMSSERSGSNLVRKILSLHSEISAPKAPHLLKTFFPILKDITISEKHQLQIVFDSFKSIVNHSLHDWKLNIRFEDFISKYDPHSVLDFFNGFYLEKCITSPSVSYIACKENDLFDYIHPLSEYFANRIKIIYLYRDPRDYAVSWMKVPGGIYTPEDAALLWNREQRKCLKVAKDFPVFFLKYEELISDTENVIKSLFDFLKIDFQENCLNTFSRKEEGTQNEYWKNLNRPILKDNYGNYLKFFDLETIYSIERIAARHIKELGYGSAFSENDLRKFYFKVKGKVNRYFHFLPKKSEYKLPDDTTHTAVTLADRMDLAVNVKRELRKAFLPNT